MVRPTASIVFSCHFLNYIYAQIKAVYTYKLCSQLLTLYHIFISQTSMSVLVGMEVVVVSAPIQRDPSPAAVEMGSNSTLMAGDVTVRDWSYSVFLGLEMYR